jgi:hypothetical protein
VRKATIAAKPKPRGWARVLVLAAVGLVSAILGEKLDISLLTTAGLCCLGSASVWIGIDVMITRRIVLPSRYYRRANETFIGVAAIAQGIQLVLIGVFLAGASVLAQLDLGAPFFRLLIRRPGALLLAFGVFALTAAVIASVGYVEQKDTTRFVYILDLLASRLLPGVILFAIGAAAIGLGLLEMFAPDLVDAWGGGYLEVLFGVK